MSTKRQYSLDTQVYELLHFVRKSEPEQLMEEIRKAYFQNVGAANRKILEDYYAKYPFWGGLDTTTGNYEALDRRALALHNGADELSWLYVRLSDYRSKAVFLGVISNWLYHRDLSPVQERAFPCYFDLDIMRCTKEEVFVDLGAYTGGTAFGYMRAYGETMFRRMYCYEITQETFSVLEKNLAAYPNILCRQKGALDRAGTFYMQENTDCSANSLGAAGSIPIEAVTIDEDIEEPVTFIKMDIEGGEQKALQGCSRMIERYEPKLAISIYHAYEDFYEIPRLIDNMKGGYGFYLRYHGGNLAPSEITLLARAEG